MAETYTEGGELVRDLQSELCTGEPTYYPEVSQDGQLVSRSPIAGSLDMTRSSFALPQCLTSPVTRIRVLEHLLAPGYVDMVR